MASSTIDSKIESSTCLPTTTNNIYVKSLQCNADELFFHPPKASAIAGSERKIRFAITWVETPEDFFIALQKNQDDVANLTLGMEKFYKETPISDFSAGFDPRVGDFVVVYCADYGNFYRACIREIREGRDIDKGSVIFEYYAYFVDYGNYEWKKLTDMAPLLEVGFVVMIVANVLYYSNHL